MLTMCSHKEVVKSTVVSLCCSLLVELKTVSVTRQNTQLLKTTQLTRSDTCDDVQSVKEPTSTASHLSNTAQLRVLE